MNLVLWFKEKKLAGGYILVHINYLNFSRNIIAEISLLAENAARS
jgi:hypothetical protein